MTIGDDGRKLTAEERDTQERRLLAKALAVILSPDWGRISERPKDGQEGQHDRK